MKTTPQNPKMLTRVLSRPNINGMVKTIRQTKLFDIERTPQTIVIKHIKSGIEVFRSLKHGPCWITRYAENLFI